tara:strand:- start:351 stop:1010 length:660 start_codon:yes stop_codon:yes gene_type:complete
MRFESRLCHLSDNKAVVLVNGWVNEKKIGSALAEASTVEVAEDKAISRLNKRLSIKNSNNINDDKNNIETKIKVELPRSKKNDVDKPNTEPSDWSNELTAIDSEIERLNWSRDDEINFLEKNLGYNNRNKITKYEELVNYLNLLKKLEISNSNKLTSTNINILIEESDNILKDLSWDYNKGREYLQKEFKVSTRKELDEKQLISFVENLKSIRNSYFSK